MIIIDILIKSMSAVSYLRHKVQELEKEKSALHRFIDGLEKELFELRQLSDECRKIKRREEIEKSHREARDKLMKELLAENVALRSRLFDDGYILTKIH